MNNYKRVLLAISISAAFYSCAHHEIACSDAKNLSEPGPYIKDYVEKNIKNEIANINNLKDKVQRITEIFNSSKHRTYVGMNRITFNKILTRLPKVKDPTKDRVLNNYLKKLNQISNTNWEMKDILDFYNKYPNKESEYYLFSISADDIVKFRMAAGCTSHAKAMMAIIKAALPKTDPKDLRYVITSLADNYNATCKKGAPRKPKDTINGHQVVIMKIDGVWYDLSSFNINGLVRFGFQDIDGDINSKNIPIKFSFYNKLGSTLIRYIGRDYNDYGCDSSYLKLMNISASGCYKSDICKWPMYRYH